MLVDKKKKPNFIDKIFNNIDKILYWFATSSILSVGVHAIVSLVVFSEISTKDYKKIIEDNDSYCLQKNISGSELVVRYQAKAYWSCVHNKKEQLEDEARNSEISRLRLRVMGLSKKK